VVIKHPENSDVYSIENYGFLGVLIRICLVFLVSFVVSALDEARKNKSNFSFLTKLYNSLVEYNTLIVPAKVTMLTIVIFGSNWIFVKISRSLKRKKNGKE
jgi:hypothetical protein